MTDKTSPSINSELPFVSIIVPCRNESGYIGKCLDSILEQDYPRDRMEVFVVDGMSDDGTREIAEKYSETHSFVRVVANPRKIVPTAMNIGIVKSSGDLIVRIDAHNIYANDYISKCVKTIMESDADNVGGAIETLPGADTNMARAIAAALSHPFGIGDAQFRIGASEPVYVDTVPFGCFRREVFERIGLFDEELARNQDDEFNLRLIKKGGKILMSPDIVSRYYARTSISMLWKMYFQYGLYKPLVVKKIGKVMTVRQLIPAVFVLSVLLSALCSFADRRALPVFLFILGLHVGANLFFSASIAAKKGAKLIVALPLVFDAIHFSYGLGYLKGILDFIILKKRGSDLSRKIRITR